MALFSNWFKTKPEGVDPNGAEVAEPAPIPSLATAAAVPAPPVASVASVRTVQPNPAHNLRVSAPTARPPISLTGQTSNPSPRVTRKVPFASPAPEPTVENAPPPGPAEPDAIVHLTVGDFIDRLPTNFVKPGAVDRQQAVEFRVSELYSDLSRGRATVPASIIYQKCPDIFARPVSDTEDVEVHLPLHRLVEQMGSTLAPREDQTPEESVGEIETPFLQVAMEDNARLPKAAGTSMGATVRAIGVPGARKPAMPSIPPPAVRSEPDPNGAKRTKQISPISPLKQPLETRPIASPTAQSAGPILSSKRPPSTVRASVAGGKIRLSAPAIGSPQNKAAMTPAVPHPSQAPRVTKVFPPRVAAASPSHQVTKKTARIQIPPISLRPAGPGSPRPPVTPVAPAPSASPARVPESLTSFKPAGKAGPAMSPPTFRSTPPPPNFVKPPPPSFSPGRSSLPPPPLLAVAPEEPPADLLAEAVDPSPAAPASVVPRDQSIEMSLAGVLRGLPDSALVVEPTSIPDNARISLPFGVIEPQLSNGRVSVSLPVFRAALPSAFNHVLADDCDLIEVPIPLQEVFQNLPSNAISLRPDQIVEEARNSFPTPFSQKAEEDARRFGAAATPAEPVPEEPATGEAERATGEAALTDAAAADLPAADLPAADLPAAELPAAELPADELPAAEETPPADSFADKAEVSETVAAPTESLIEFPEPIVAEEEPEAPAPEWRPDIPSAPSDEPELEESPRKEAGDPLEHTPADQAQLPEGVAAPAAEESPTAAGQAAPELDRLPYLGEPTAELERLPAAEEPEAEVAPPVAGEEAAPEFKRAPAVFAAEPKSDSPLQTLFMTEDELDAKAVARLASQLPGLESCSVMFDDGLLLASSLPQDGKTEGFSAMAPALYHKVLNFTSELALGELLAVTLYTEQGLLTLFTHGSICLSVRHGGRGFLPGVREKLMIVTRELAGMYAPAKAEPSEPALRD